MGLRPAQVAGRRILFRYFTVFELTYDAQQYDFFSPRSAPDYR